MSLVMLTCLIPPEHEIVSPVDRLDIDMFLIFDWSIWDCSDYIAHLFKAKRDHIQQFWEYYYYNTEIFWFNILNDLLLFV